MTFEKNIPNATAKRLSLYYRIFKRFHRENIDKASSKQIAEAIGIDPATVRRDFSYFGELGRRGFGYDVNKLMTFFAELLNDNATTKVLLVGVGNVGCQTPWHLPSVPQKISDSAYGNHNSS